MPAQKRPLETSTPPPSPQPSLEEEKADDSLQGSENQDQKETDNVSDSEESPYSSDGEKEEYVFVKLAELRKEVQCPICLGIIRKTRTVMECLHRFCRECIDKSMRLGNNECPACRTHCASRRSLRDDPNYDALIATLYPDIDKYEEEELAVHEEEKARNQQIQASITQTFRRQAEALGKKRTSARVAAGALARRQNYRNSGGRRNHRVIEHQGSDEEDGSKDSSSADERSAEVKSRRFKKWGGARTSQQSSGANADAGCDDTELEANRELIGASSGLIGGIEMLGWGRGGLRSHSRHGGTSWAGGKLSKSDRLPKLIDYLRGLNQNEELKVSLTLISLHEDKIPSLIRPYLCCSPRSTVRHLCQYVARQTSMEASEIEILMVKDYHPVNTSLSFENKLGLVNPSNSPSHNELQLLNKLQLLNEHQTLEEIHASSTEQKNLVLAYRQKVQSQGD